MEIMARICDICWPSVATLAVAVYWNDEDEEFHCCAEHLVAVMETGLAYELIESVGEE